MNRTNRLKELIKKEEPFAVCISHNFFNIKDYFAIYYPEDRSFSFYPRLAFFDDPKVKMIELTKEEIQTYKEVRLKGGFTQSHESDEGIIYEPNDRVSFHEFYRNRKQKRKKAVQDDMPKVKKVYDQKRQAELNL